MPKYSSDALFQLVRSLSKSEKRYFKLYVSRLNNVENKKFMKLFNQLDKQKVYNEVKIMSRNKNFKPEQFSNMKAHLYKQLLHCIKVCNTPNITDIQIRNFIDYSQVLYNKCLYKQCVKMLDKAKELAVKNDRSILLLDILELEKQVVGQTVAAKNEKRVEQIVRETQSVAASIANINIFSNLSLRLNSLYVKVGFIRSERDFEKVRKFFLSSLPDYDESKLSFHEKLYLYYSFVGYYFFIQDFEKGYEYSRKWLKLFEDNPEMTAPKLEMYIKSINCLMVAQNKLLKYHEFVATGKKLEGILKMKELILTENIQMLLFKYRYVHEINRHFMLGDFTGGISLISTIEGGLEKFASRLDKHYILIFYYKIVCLCFGSGNHKEAIVWLNKIINSKDIDLREDIHSFARIMNLISHYELGNTDLVEYHIKSTYRFLLKKGDLYQFQRIILNFLKQLALENTQRNLINAFAGLKTQLLPLLENPYEKRAFIYFDIISWLESKIENRPVEEIIKEKAGRKISQRGEGNPSPRTNDK